MIVLSAQNVAKSFGVNAVLKDVSFTMQQGDRIGLVGVNGCGKSTLMYLLDKLYLLPEDHGEISECGMDGLLEWILDFAE